MFFFRTRNPLLVQCTLYLIFFSLFKKWPPPYRFLQPAYLLTGQPLPPHLVPPSLRQPPPGGAPGQQAGAAAGPGSAGGTAPGTPSRAGSDVAGATDGPGSPNTFEDKRRENFNKGQAELERRRQSLADQQKKEEEERKKKEKEEAEAREKQK